MRGENFWEENIAVKVKKIDNAQENSNCFVIHGKHFRKNEEIEKMAQIWQFDMSPF